MNKQQFFNSMNYMRVKPAVVDGRITFSGSSSHLRKALDEMPELEAELILREAIHNDDLMDVIQERACIRWADGYSDTLYSAVMCNIVSTEEKIARDENGEIIRKKLTDWDKELSKYRRAYNQ